MASTEKFTRALAAITLLLLAPVAACGDSGSATTVTTGTSDTSSSGSTGTSTGTSEASTTTGTSNPTSSTGSTSEAPTTDPGTSSTSTGVTGSTSESTGTTTTDTTTGTTTDTTTDTTDTTGTTANTTGDPIGSTCEQDSDCQIHTDCCHCDVLADGEAPQPCNIMECFVDVCATLDIGAAPPVCRFGRCTFEKVTCNPTAVTCKALPPDCPPGHLPSVNGDCWSGKCTPVEACDWAPDCAICNTDPTDPLVCVQKLQKGAFHVCEPKPADCGDAPEIDCDCGAQICDASPPHTECQDQVPGIICECPFC